MPDTAWWFRSIRGYGRSGKPPIHPDHRQQSKRTVAGDLLAVMDQLGHRHFAVVGHDRGALVALRLALDQPERLSHLVVLDAVPIIEHLDRCDEHFAVAWFHWFFFAVPDKPERAINADPLAWYSHDVERMGKENHAEWVSAVTDPDTVRAMLEDYRSGLVSTPTTTCADRDAGTAHRVPDAGAVVQPRDDLRLHGDPVTIWRSWCTDVRGAAIDSGHHMAEDAPQTLSSAASSSSSVDHPEATVARHRSVRAAHAEVAGTT